MITFPACRSPSLRMLRNFVRKHDGGRRETKTAQAWAAGDYRTAGARIQIVSEMLCEAVDLRGGQAVLDVRPAPATRRLLPRVDGARWRRSITFPACSRSGVFGPPPKESRWRFSKVMPRRLAFPTTRSMSCCRPLARCLLPTTRKRPTSSYVCAALEGKSGWQTGRRRDSEEPFGAVTQLVPPPQGQKPPSLWGTEDHLRQLFGDRVTLEVKPQHFVFRYRSPAHWIEVFSTTFGPVMKGLEALNDPGRERLRLELHRVIGEFNKATDGTMVVPSEYLEVVATKS
jgi:hypothetical protein